MATYAYQSGTAVETIDVPANAVLTRVSVIAGASVAATVQIGGGSVITVPAGFSFDESVLGDSRGLDVTLGGTIQSYYVAWTT